MLIAGSDVSGSDTGGQHRIIAIVMGTEEAINSLRKNIKVKKIHMSKLDEYKQKEVINNLDFRDGELFALSLEVEKVKTVKFIHESNKLKEKYFDIGLVYQHFDMLLLDIIKSKIEEFSYKFNGGIKSIMIESDNDMDNTIRAWGMKRVYTCGKAYELADALAFCCNTNRRVEGCIRLNLVGTLRKQMENDLLI